MTYFDHIFCILIYFQVVQPRVCKIFKDLVSKFFTTRSFALKSLYESVAHPMRFPIGNARCLNFGMCLYLHPYIVYASSEGSGGAAHMSQTRQSLRCSPMRVNVRTYVHCSNYVCIRSVFLGEKCFNANMHLKQFS